MINKEEIFKEFLEQLEPTEVPKIDKQFAEFIDNGTESDYKEVVKISKDSTNHLAILKEYYNIYLEHINKLKNLRSDVSTIKLTKTKLFDSCSVIKRQALYKNEDKYRIEHQFADYLIQKYTSETKEMMKYYFYNNDSTAYSNSDFKLDFINVIKEKNKLEKKYDKLIQIIDEAIISIDEENFNNEKIKKIRNVLYKNKEAIVRGK